MLSLADDGSAAKLVQGSTLRARIVIEPREVLAEFGVDVAPDVEVRVWDSNAEIRYMVLPMRPAGTEGWSEEKLASLVTRDAMIGTDIPKVKA